MEPVGRSCARVVLVVLIGLTLGVTACRHERGAGTGSPATTPSCVSDEMGRSPCRVTTTAGSELGAANARDESDRDVEERAEYAERRDECRRVLHRYGFYAFKFCTSYGDQDS